MRKYILMAGSILCIFLFPGLSQGVDLNGLQPPAPYGVFSTMTATSPKKGQAAISFTYDTLINSSFYRFGSNIAYGMYDRLELSLSVSEQRDGFEDIALGIKHRIIDKGADGPSVAYLVSASVDSGSTAVSTDGSFGGGIIISDRVGPVQGHTNLFYAWPLGSGLKGEFTASAGIVFSAAHNVWLLGEIYGRSSHFSKKIDQMETRLGYRVRVGDNLYANLGFGIDMKHKPANYRLMASLALLFPQEERTIERIYERR